MTRCCSRRPRPRPRRLCAIEIFLLSILTSSTILITTDGQRIVRRQDHSLSSAGENSNGHYPTYHHQQIIVEHPSDQQAKIGDKVEFKCRIRNLRGEPQWCIDDFCLGLAKASSQNSNKTMMNDHHQPQHLKGRPRYRIVGDRSRGEFNLLVEPVQLQDNMFFYCMATAASETVKAVKSKKAFLTVLSITR